MKSFAILLLIFTLDSCGKVYHPYYKSTASDPHMGLGVETRMTLIPGAIPIKTNRSPNPYDALNNSSLSFDVNSVGVAAAMDIIKDKKMFYVVLAPMSGNSDVGVDQLDLGHAVSIQASDASDLITTLDEIGAVMISTDNLPTFIRYLSKTELPVTPRSATYHSNANGDVTGASISEESLQERAWIPSVEIRFRSTPAEHSAFLILSDDSYSQQFNFRNGTDVANFRTRIATALDQLKSYGM